MFAMFIFQFKLQGEIKDYLIKKQKSGLRLSAIITALVFIIPAVIISVIWYDDFIVRAISIGLTIFALLFLICFSRWNGPLNGFYKYIPQQVIIDSKQGTIETIGSEKYCYQCEEMNWIKEIIDWGGWYEFKFYGRCGSWFFICQKNLIVEGTIEEFEELFKDKIVRKYKQKD